MDLKDKRILICGGNGLLGKALQKKLTEQGFSFYAPTHKECDYRNKSKVYDIVMDYLPHLIINCFVSFGGIKNNEKHPYKIFHDNLQGNLNIIDVARRLEVQKYIQISSQCVYGDKAPVPFLEEDIWNYGLPTENNAPYGISKRVLHLAIDSARKEFGFNGIVLVPSNMYGPGDNFHPEHTHVIPALIRRFIESKEQGKQEVEVWGSGESTREFLYSEDCADAIILAAEKYDSSEPVNIGTGKEISISDLAHKLANIVEIDYFLNYNGLDGQSRRVNDTSKAKERFGFEAKTSLEEGLKKTIEYFMNNRNNLREKVYYE